MSAGGGNGINNDEPAAAAPVGNEPVIRETKKTEAAPAADVSDVIKKWSKKG